MRTGKARVGRVVMLVVSLALASSAGNSSGAATSASWLTFGNSPQRTGLAPSAARTAKRSFVLPLEGRVTAQVLASDGRFFTATTSGEVVASDANGFVLWHDELGQLAQTCEQLDGYGVVGTGVVDARSGTLYLADAFGRLHALDVANGAERNGWPVRVFTDFRRELAWGALTLADGAVYVPTASYCDAPSLGGIHRVDVASQQVTSWYGVPSEEGGGGGVWGWGGATYSPSDNALFAVTANAFPGGTNVGTDFSESAGYGEHLVELAPDLSVEASSHPNGLTDGVDLDFVGSPVVFKRSGCGELAAATDKDGVLFLWRTNQIGSGPIATLRLEQYDSRNPLLSQLAWSPSLSSLYAVTGTQFIRIAVDAHCAPKITWARALGTHTENGSPTIAGDTVWFAVNGTPKLVAYDGRTGKRVFSAPLGGETVQSPTVVDGRVAIGTMSGLVDGYTFGPAANPHRKMRPLASWFGARYGWQGRPSGVYATENGGKSWRRVYRGTPLAVLRLSRTRGLISIASAPGRCMCTTRQFWTHDGGKTWHETATLGSRFTLGGGHVYFWNGGTLRLLGPLAPVRGPARLSSQTVATLTDGRISDVQPIPGGVIALVSSRVNGQGWDTDPRVLVVRGEAAEVVSLPMERGRILVNHIEVSWPNLTVVGINYVANPVRDAVWVSDDGGADWAAVN